MKHVKVILFAFILVSTWLLVGASSMVFIIRDLFSYGISGIKMGFEKALNNNRYQAITPLIAFPGFLF
ncbi:MAG: hypothetical protein ACLP51_05750 [Syntrophobacteraceae bacterium]